MIQAVNDMSRSIGWVILGLFFLVLWWNVAADPLSGWHPSARDVFTIPTSMTQSGPASPILPIAEENNTTRNDNRSSSSVTAASIMLNQAPEQVGTRILVRYNRSEVSALADVESEGVALQEDLSTSLPGLVIYETRNKSEEEAIKALSAVPGVLYAEPDYILSIDRIPNDPDLWRSWGISNTGQVYRENTPAGTAGADGKVLPAWDTATEADDVIIAVLDTGIDYTHPDLKANIWTGPSGEHGYNVINQTTDPMDDNGHGTHCAGIIGAVGNNGIGTAGISWKTKLMAVKAIGANGKAYTSDIIKGIEYATSAGAHIISCSFGGPEHSQALYDAIAQSQALFVCAAGNQGKNTDQNPYYPASYPLSNIIAVASTRADDTLSSSSNYGTTVHLAAPGENIYSTTIPVPGGNRYTYMTGTSRQLPLYQECVHSSSARQKP
jgi:subtilisin family serine protease